MKKRRLLCCRLVPLVVVSMAVYVSAMVQDSVVPVSPCPCAGESARYLEPFKERIAHSANVEEGRLLALSAVGDAHRALNEARFLAPWSGDMRAAQMRVGEVESHLQSAQSLDEVETEFSGLVGPSAAAPLDSVTPAQAGTPGNFEIASPRHGMAVGGKCNYSTGEIIAIVLGFILGIIPGIILLILLC